MMPSNRSANQSSAFHSWGRRRYRHTSDSGVCHLANPTQLSEGVLKSGRISSHVSHHQCASGFTLGADDRLGIALVERHRLLYEDHLVMFQAEDGMGGVVGIGIGNQDDVHVRGRTQLLRHARRLGRFCGHLLGAVGESVIGRVAEVRDLEQVGHQGEGGQVDHLNDLTTADDPNSHWGEGGGRGSNHLWGRCKWG